MRILICLAVVLAASAANAQNSTIERNGNSVTITSKDYTVTTTQTSKSANGATYTTTVTRTGGYNPMGSGGYHPMGR